MNFLIIMAVMGSCAALPQYTREVSIAREQFFQAYRAAQAASAPKTQQAIVFQDFTAPQPLLSAKWNGPLAATLPAGVPGAVSQVAQTADFAAAEAEFQRAYGAALAATGHRVPAAQAFPAPVPVQSTNTITGTNPRWTGPFAATIPAGVPGSTNVFDTAEVAAAKEAHRNAHIDQLVRVGGAVPSRSIF